MSDLKKYVRERKKRDKAFSEGYDEGYEQFKIRAKKKWGQRPLLDETPVNSNSPPLIR
jgi:hypothetical protein